MRPIDFFAPQPVLRLLAASAVLLGLAGCDKLTATLGLNEAQQKDTEARAIGGACRHALRGVEDCYTLNPKAPKAAVFDGWKEMDQYMRDNKIEGTPAVVAKPPEPAPRRAAPRASAPAES
ncbi:hypothetical protein [Acidovorax sp.]|jgi:hypothetical protein|uniref:hypothetical protein n=1 Tax=Acidovorax sp. TaxID=1872122 RepID=UPI00391F145C